MDSALTPVVSRHTAHASQLAASQAPPGLTDADVQQRIANGQTNAYTPKAARSTWDIIRDNVFTVFNMVLLIAVAATLAVGLGTAGARMLVIGDTLFSGASVWINMIVGIVQELLAKRKLDRLAAMAVRKARVRRNGQVIEIPVEQIVLDDLVLLEPGDRAPVDGPVVESRALEMDESLLTGESDSVSKAVGDAVMSGTFCLAGAGVVRAEKIGADSYANRLTATARKLKTGLTPLQQKLTFVVQSLVVLMLVVVVLQLLAAWRTDVPMVDALRYTLTIVTSFVPAGLILANTVSLSVGAVQIARLDTLVQRINAIESMGNVTVLCTDKTGTLTQNKLTVQEVVPLGAYSLADALNLLAQYAGSLAAQNKTAGAIAEFAGQPRHKPVVVAEIPFSSTRKWGAVTLRDPDLARGDLRTLILGSPELVLDPQHLHFGAVQAQVRAFTEQSLRVVALVEASSQVDASLAQLPDKREPVALVVLRDEIRPDITDTMSQFERLGVRVKVISGDSADTVRAIAQRAGVKNLTAITEQELSQLSGAAFDTAVRMHGLFARITPETKQRIVASLMKQGEYVAMVGDGVNDVPAIKQARMGVAMNDGAQITKDVSELVLLNNSMSTLPRALQEGQRITQKIYASSRLYLAKSVITILAFLFIGYVALPFPAEPRQISWIATMTVSLPCVLLAFGLLKPGYTFRFTREVLAYSILVGFVGGVVFTAAYVAEYALAGEAAARMAFTMVNLHFSMHVFWDVHDVSVFNLDTIRKHPREFLAGLGFLGVGIAVPQMVPQLFNAVPLTLSGWLIALFLPLAGALLMRAAVYGPFTRGMLRALRK
ncbi:MAG: HAD-IC family P-type ATPase [Anaerolineae bacterium]